MTTTVAETTLLSIPWLTSFTEATTVARAQKKPIMVDVRQEDCGGCDKLEDETFADPHAVSYTHLTLPTKA